MNVFDKLLGIGLVEDLTETAWWTDTVFRGLEKRPYDKQDTGFDGASAPTQQFTELE